MIIKKFKKYILALAPFILLIGLLASTDPRRLPLVLLIAPFILIFGCLLVIFLIVLRRLTAHHQAFAKKQFAVAAILAFLPSLLLILRSIDELTIKDVLILSIFIGFVVFYIDKLSFRSK